MEQYKCKFKLGIWQQNGTLHTVKDMIVYFALVFMSWSRVLDVFIYWVFDFLTFFPTILMQRHVYGHKGKDIQIFADNSSLAINPSYINSWLGLLSRTPRVAPFLSKTDPFISALKKVLLLWPIFMLNSFVCSYIHYSLAHLSSFGSVLK